MQRISRRSCIAGLLGAAAAAVLPTAAAAAVGSRAPSRDPAHTFEGYANNWLALKRRNVVMQQYDYSCGAAALATILRYYWEDNVSEKQILEAMLKVLTVDEVKDRVKNGMSITDLRRAAVELGYLSSIGTMTFQQLSQSKIPLLVPLKLKGFDHFVVYRGVVFDRVYLADPVRGNVRPTIPEFCGQWQKGAILVVIKKGAQPREWSPLSIRADEARLGDTTLQWLRREIPRPGEQQGR
ncbi:MAG: C39 family peptidase [Thermoguttaceae bacterium]